MVMSKTRHARTWRNAVGFSVVLAAATSNFIAGKVALQAGLPAFLLVGWRRRWALNSAA